MGIHDQSLFGGALNVADDGTLIYPGNAGWKGTAETGKEAAKAISPKLGRLQALVRDAVIGRGTAGLTPEEGADSLGIPRVSIQPRFSELAAKGVIRDSGMRRINPSSRKTAVVWVAAELKGGGE